jgi:hypothetical protein
MVEIILEKTKGIPLGPFLKYRHIFLQITTAFRNMIYTLFKLNVFKSIYLYFFKIYLI